MKKYVNCSDFDAKNLAKSIIICVRLLYKLYLKLLFFANLIKSSENHPNFFVLHFKILPIGIKSIIIYHHIYKVVFIYKNWPNISINFPNKGKINYQTTRPFKLNHSKCKHCIKNRLITIFNLKKWILFEICNFFSSFKDMKLGWSL